MQEVILIDGTNLITALFALIAFMGGYFLKGVFFALLNEAIYKKVARYIIRKGKEWEKKHPVRLEMFKHHINRHEGLRISQCDKCKLS